MPITFSGRRKKLRRTAGATALMSMLAAVATSSATAAPAPPTPVVPAVPVPAVVAAPVAAASAQVSAALAVCPGQTFAQPFSAAGDSNYYTLAEGSEFNEGAEGWELFGGAKIVEAARPDGTVGNVLDLTSGAYAVSPPTCVTLQYPTARTFAENVKGGGVTVTVAYGLEAKLIKTAGQINPKPKAGWELSSPFNVQPQTTGKEEGVREVRFVYSVAGKTDEDHVFGLYVDPRFTH